MSKEVKQMLNCDEYRCRSNRSYTSTCRVYYDSNICLMKTKLDNYDRLKKSHEALLKESKPYICTPIDGDNYVSMCKNCKTKGRDCFESGLCEAIREAEEL